MSDDNILDIKNFKKVDGQTVQVKGKKPNKKKNKSKTTKENPPFTDQEIYVEFEFDADSDDMEQMLIEENELLHVELLKERTRRQQLEKILKKHLGNDKTGVKNNGNKISNTDGTGQSKEP